jgi:hypothetical protein
MTMSTTMSTMDLSAQVEAFAAARATRLSEKDEELRPVVDAALTARLAGATDWARELAIAAAVLWLETYEAEGGQPEPGNVDRFVERLTARLELTADVPISQRQAQIARVTNWVAVFTLNDSTVAAAASRDEDLRLRWVTMRDGDVRATHRPLEGQTTPVGGTFDVNGHALHFPGEPVGPPEIWIECRCMAFPVPGGEMSTLTAATTPGEVAQPAVEPDPVDVDPEDVPPEWDDEMDIEVPWHGILAVEGIPTGDLRRFASQALTFDDFPMSLTWQRASAERHDGAVVIGRITNAWTGPDGLVYGEGMFRVSPEADEVIDMIANGDLRGVSVELDSVAMEYSDVDGNPIDLETAASDGDVYQHLTAGRVRSATVLPVAAFAESYVALGPWPEGEGKDAVTASCAPCVAAEMDSYAADLAAFAISEASWDGSAGRFDDAQWRRACVVDRGASHETAKERYAVPIREPNGDLSRAGVHAAAGRINQTDAPPEAIAAGKRKIIAAYKQLGEDPPESLTASAFAPIADTHDAPGWITHPAETQRLRTYWTRGRGAAKIRWGVPGDFNRCRRQLAKYVPNPSYLAGTCANLHYVALGFWPGRHLASATQTASASPAVSEAGVLAASGEAPEPEVAASPAPNLADPADLPRAEWFADPGLPMPSPITIVQDKETGRYRLVGHAAAWGVCHIGLGLSVGQEGCTVAPRSVTNYAHYRVGAIETDGGLVPIGRITMGTGHAGANLSAFPAAEHYDNTGTVVADVAAGEDEHGIWLAGLLRPNVTAEQRAELLAATISGDWRWIGGNLEMVATLAVNTPGFPIPRLSVAASGGRQTTLFAAGIVPPRTNVADDTPAVLVSAAEVARELHRLAKVDAAREQALAVLDTTRRSVNSERAAKALSVIASGK